MGDYIIRAIAAEGMIRAFAAITTDMVSEAGKIHGASGVATAALGRTLTAAAMMSKMFKNDRDVLTIQIKGDGPLGGIVAVSDSKANVRGYVNNPLVYLPLNNYGKFDVAGAIGKNGYLNVIKDLGMKEPYVGYVDLYTGEIGEDIAYYFAVSEQVPSIVSLGVLVAPDESVINAGGFMIQLMPGADEGLVEFLESKVGNMQPVTSLFEIGKTPDDILNLILGEKGLEITDKTSCGYLCNCSRERMERNLISLGAKDILEIMQEQHGAELQCHFCNRKYNFSEQELLQLVQA
jgi:Disulfide bond chaperones of the HSP33 family